MKNEYVLLYGRKIERMRKSYHNIRYTYYSIELLSLGAIKFNCRQYLPITKYRKKNTSR